MATVECRSSASAETRIPVGVQVIRIWPTIDHKTIGKLYLSMSLTWFVLGGIIAVLTRSELACPRQQRQRRAAQTALHDVQQGHTASRPTALLGASRIVLVEPVDAAGHLQHPELATLTEGQRRGPLRLGPSAGVGHVVPATTTQPRPAVANPVVAPGLRPAPPGDCCHRAARGHRCCPHGGTSPGTPPIGSGRYLSGGSQP